MDEERFFERLESLVTENVALNRKEKYVLYVRTPDGDLLSNTQLDNRKARLCTELKLEPEQVIALCEEV